MIFHRILQKRKLQSIYFLSSVPLYSRSSGILQTELEFSTIAVYSGIPRFFNIKKSIHLSPFFFSPVFFQKSLYTSTNQTILHARNHINPPRDYFHFFFARFYRQIGVRLWRAETFQAYTYVATFPMIVNPISSWFIGSTSEWTWKLTCVLLIDLSHIFYLKIIIDKYRQIKYTIRLKFPFLFFYG